MIGRHQRYCLPCYQKLAERKLAAARRDALLERLDPAILP
jgi:hypothetical protein